MDKMIELIKKKLLYKSSVFADIMVGFAAVLAGYFYYYENKKIVSNIENTASVNYAIKITLGVIIIILWLALSFQNGVKKRHSFLICTLCFWIIPQIVKYCVVTFANGEYSDSLQRSLILLTKYLSGINYLSLKTVGDAINNSTNIPYYITLNIIILLFEVTFFAGFMVAKHFRDTENHRGKDEDEKDIIIIENPENNVEVDKTI